MTPLNEAIDARRTFVLVMVLVWQLGLDRYTPIAYWLTVVVHSVHWDSLHGYLDR